MSDRKTIAEHFKWYYEKGFITARDGNAAYWDGRSYSVTASGVTKYDLDPDDYSGFVLLNEEGKKRFAFESNPSIESQAHIDALQATGKTCSVHVHSPNAVALFAIFPNVVKTFIDWHERIPEVLNTKWPELFRYTKVGKTVPFLEPGSKELHDALKQSFSQKPDIVVMQNHGVLVVGDDFEQCREHVVRLEHISGILLKILSSSGGDKSLIL